MHYDGRVKLHVFDGESTMKNDYRVPTAGELKNGAIVKWPVDKQEMIPRTGKTITVTKYHPECNESFVKLRDDAYVPFHLLWQTKPIVGPSTEDRKIYVKPIDCGKEESIRTRPRRYISPAVSIDDVTDKEKRDLLVDNMYTTQFHNDEQEANFVVEMKTKEKKDDCCCNVYDEKKTGEYEFIVRDMPHTPLLTSEIDDTEIKISSSMRKKYYDEWDTYQNRASVCPTSYFWTHTDIPRNIKIADSLISPEMNDEITELIKINRMRSAHDRPMQGWTGHEVGDATGIPLRKREFPVSHPMLTTLQAVNYHYEEDILESKNKI